MDEERGSEGGSGVRGYREERGGGRKKEEVRGKLEREGVHYGIIIKDN